jgi:hypothetical protein
MDYFQGVVTEYLRADRACFINPEYYLRNDLSPIEKSRKSYWYVDVLAFHMRHKCAYLCEVTYAKEPRALVARLRSWHSEWTTVKATLVRDSSLPNDWTVRPWIFVPEARLSFLKAAAPEFAPAARFTRLEDTLPWHYHWNHELPSDLQ